MSVSWLGRQERERSEGDRRQVGSGGSRGMWGVLDSKAEERMRLGL